MFTIMKAPLFALFLVNYVYCLCPNGYLKHDESCYKMIRTFATWAEATIYCRAMGSELANLETAVEDHFVHGMLQNLGGSYDPPKFWLGGNDIVTESEWMWAKTHTKFTYTNWAPGQPDKGQGENCLELSKNVGWNWNDETCEHRKYFICERPSEEVDSGEIVG
ncbi:perlucin-like [Mytilus galloprovincialis]|uniref:perlucin-like n=1 Tax=Mytilus galloprovincialis TaxID=29158 RepID=UPI003F7B4EBA